MTLVEQSELPSPLGPRQKAMLFGVVALVATLVGAVSVTVWIATSPRPAPALVASSLSAACRAAIVRAKVADQNGSSEEAIRAATQMLRACQA